ncbi:MAG: 4Fe-4S double cluster binding domain-containing protein [candidate division Zixibacteria bacterium]
MNRAVRNRYPSGDEQTVTALHKLVAERGYKGRVVPAAHLNDLRDDIERNHSTNQFCEEFFQESLTGFDFGALGEWPEAKSVIIIAMPQPLFRVTFELNGQTIPLIIPPTYSFATDARVEAECAEVLSTGGYSLMKRSLPLKSLAVHSGLAKYGKNNLVYVDSMGSYCRLIAFYSDLTVSDSDWREWTVMDQCSRCQACKKACPTAAIDQGRFLLRAEKCLTFLNERKQPFPAWLDESAHHCLVGCISCQTVCPANRQVEMQVETVANFTQLETEQVLQGGSDREVADLISKKLGGFDCVGNMPQLTRNLRALFDRTQNRERGWKMIRRPKHSEDGHV